MKYFVYAAQEYNAMTIKSFTYNPFQTNCYVCSSGQDAVVVDPSCYTVEEVSEVIDYIQKEQLHIVHILLTHGHIDHILGCKALVHALGKGYMMHREDEPLLAQAPLHGEMFGTPMEEPPAPTSYIKEGDTINVGNDTWEVIHTPGHSPGSVCFVDHSNTFVLSGDVVFFDSIGRTDLWRGSLPVLMESIFSKVMKLDDAYTLFPGHGQETTVGRERQHNPFLVEHAS